MSPAKKPKLGGQVHTDNRRTGNQNGRPRTDDRLKDVILNCLRSGLLLSTAMDHAGIGAGQLHRWKQELDHEGVTFGQRMRQARTVPRVLASNSLMHAIRRVVDPETDEVRREADMQTVRWYLGRTPDFAETPKVDPQDAARQIRAFVVAAFRSQEGSADAVEAKFDEDDLADEDQDA